MLNRIQLIGRLGKDPEVRYTKNGKAVANFSMATSIGKGDDQVTTWHQITAWEKLGELCGQYLSKGRLAYVEGSLEQRKWTNKEGVEVTTFEVNARNVVFLDKADGAQSGAGKPRQQDLPRGGRGGGGGPKSRPDDEGGDYGPPAMEDDVPF